MTKLLVNILFFIIFALTAWNYHLLYRLKEVSGFPPREFIEDRSVPRVEPVNDTEASCELIPQKPEPQKPLPSPIKKGLTTKMEKLFRGKLTGYSQNVITIASDYGIDPKLLAAIACHESGYGTSKKAVECNNVTGSLYYNKKTKKWMAREFATVADCLRFTASNLRRNYIDSGLTTIASIGNKYCPVGAANDPNNLNQHWVTGVTRIYNSL